MAISVGSLIEGEIHLISIKKKNLLPEKKSNNIFLEKIA
jgi:hypothetical protein